MKRRVSCSTRCTLTRPRSPRTRVVRCPELVDASNAFTSKPKFFFRSVRLVHRISRCSYRRAQRNGSAHVPYANNFRRGEQISFIEQYHTGLDVWRKGFEHLRIPNLYNLRAAPFERGTQSAAYDWSYFAPRGFVIVPAQAVVAQWLESFKEFPIRQKPASFNLDDVMR